MLADWMHGAWYRAPKVENRTLLGRDNELFPGMRLQSEDSGESVSCPDSSSCGLPAEGEPAGPSGEGV